MLSLTASRTLWGRKCPRKTHVAYQSSPPSEPSSTGSSLRATTLQRSQNGTFHAAWRAMRLTSCQSSISPAAAPTFSPHSARAYR